MPQIICHNIKGDKISVDSSKITFRPSVYAVIFQGDKVLLSPQWDGYDWPGGGIKITENIDEALRREVREETGLTVRRGKIIMADSDYFISPCTDDTWHGILMYYLGEITGGQLSTEFLDEHEKKYAKQARWMAIREIPQLKFYNPVDNVELVKLACKLR